MFDDRKGFMDTGDSRWPHRYPHLSRDWVDIDCKASCEFQKNNKCLVPSLAEIGEDGRCKGFKAKMSTKREGVV